MHKQGLFKNIVFRSVALVIKKLYAILEFFLHGPDFLPPWTLHFTLEIIFFNPLNFYLSKVTKFQGDSFKNECWDKKNYKRIINSFLKLLKIFSTKMAKVFFRIFSGARIMHTIGEYFWTYSFLLFVLDYC